MFDLVNIFQERNPGVNQDLPVYRKADLKDLCVTLN